MNDDQHETLGATELRRHLGRVLRRIELDEVTFVVTRYGEPVAVITAYDDAPQGKRQEG